ncbi:MAG: hypothetical protein ABFD13_01400 [Candidatus Cryosericum sp.]|nr:hypothetical protein [bacterium]
MFLEKETGLFVHISATVATPCVVELTSCAEGTVLANRKTSLYLDFTAPTDENKGIGSAE